MSVTRRLKRLTVASLGLVALIAAVAFVAPYFVSTQQARLAAVRALESATGVEPQVSGAVYLSLLPTPAVRIEEVRLTDGQRPAFAAAAIRAHVRLLPLLLGRVEIASVVFEHPHLRVRTTEAGGVVVGMPGRAPARPIADELPEVRFENGTVQFQDSQGEREPLSNVSAAIAWSGSGITASGAFQWRGQPATFNLALSDLAALEQGNRSALRLRIEGADLKFGFDGGVAYRNGVQADGTVAAESPSLRTMLAHLTPTPPITRAGFGAFKLKAQLALTPASVALTKLAVELDGNRAEGGITIQQAKERTVVQATLATDHADLTPYSGGFALIDSEGNDWSREPIKLSGLDLFDLDMRFSASRVTVRQTELTAVAATASMRNGAFTLAVGDARFHGGQLRGKATLAGNGETADVKIDGTVSDFQLSPGLSALANVQNLEGKGTLTVKLEGRGSDMHALSRELSGTVSLDAGAGVLRGINVEQTLHKFERNPYTEFSSGRTSFERLNARLNLYGGTARIETARVENAQVRVQLSGEASVVFRDFNLNGTAMLMRAATTGNRSVFALPFLVRGPWSQPYLVPDPTGLLQRSGEIAPEGASGAKAWAALRRGG